jgi:hypothetical protein
VGSGLVPVHSPNPLRGYRGIIQEIGTVCRDEYLAGSARFDKAVANHLDCSGMEKGLRLFNDDSESRLPFSRKFK